MNKGEAQRGKIRVPKGLGGVHCGTAGAGTQGVRLLHPSMKIQAPCGQRTWRELPDPGRAWEYHMPSLPHREAAVGDLAHVGVGFATQGVIHLHLCPSALSCFPTPLWMAVLTSAPA